ncbi:hypothetical protein [Fusobacterium sp. MFO224]|uniref:hypothetical protein n=1 Tax=Fusobacterium sp. MFO224 TaxID=3378070 RepID=UPI003852B8A5
MIKIEYKVEEVKIDCGLEVEKPIEGILKQKFGESFLIIKKCELEKIKDNSFKKYSKKISGLIFEIMEDNRPGGYQNPVDLGDSFKISRIEFKKTN